MISTISTKLILKAIDFYENYDFEMIDVPLLVEEATSKLTKPLGCCDIFHTKDFVYVASAEQSFIQLYKEGKLSHGKYMALTPCCRDDTPDNTHFLTFLKLELICVGSDCIDDTLNSATEFFKTLTDNLTQEITNTGIDLNICGVEIGSYGIRKMPDGVNYVYGTGIAEPRLSYCLENFQ